MSIHTFDHLRKSMDMAEISPELLQSLTEEILFFLQMIKVKLGCDNPIIREDAENELNNFKTLIEQHPVLSGFLSASKK